VRDARAAQGGGRKKASRRSLKREDLNQGNLANGGGVRPPPNSRFMIQASGGRSRGGKNFNAMDTRGQGISRFWLRKVYFNKKGDQKKLGGGPPMCIGLKNPSRGGRLRGSLRDETMDGSARRTRPFSTGVEEVGKTYFVCMKKTVSWSFSGER